MTETLSLPSLSDPSLDGDPEILTEEMVIDFLFSHPDFINRHPEVLDLVEPPSPWREAGVVDMQQFLVRRMRDEIDQLRACAENVIQTSRTNMAIQFRTHNAILALLAATGLGDLIRIVRDDLPLLLDVDVVILGIEAGGRPLAEPMPGDVSTFPVGMVDEIVGVGRPVSLVDQVLDDGSVFGAAAGLVGSAAFARMDVGDGTAPGMLCLGAGEPDVFHPDQGTELVAFLARVLERCLAYWKRIPA